MLFDKTAILTLDERKNPLQMLQELEVDYKFHELQEIISTIVEVCLTTENDDFSDPIQRANLLTEGRHLLKVLEVCNLLITDREKV